jgi:hypothetical protein
MLQYGLAVLMLCSSAWLESHHKSGKTQKVIYPNGRVVYEAIPVKPVKKQTEAPASRSSVVEEAPPPAAEATPTPATTDVTVVQDAAPAGAPKPCDGCGPGTDPVPSGHCKQGLNEPVVIPGNHPDCDTNRVCTDKVNKPDGPLPEMPGRTIPFYKRCEDFKGTAKVPVLKHNKREEYVFDKVRFEVKCCSYEVCVVTKCCCIDTENCELDTRKVNLRACFRTSGLVDVYVIGQPGMPLEWVLDLGLTEAQYTAKYPGGPRP